MIDQFVIEFPHKKKTWNEILSQIKKQPINKNLNLNRMLHVQMTENNKKHSSLLNQLINCIETIN